MVYLPDTSVIINVLRRHGPWPAVVRSLLVQGDTLAGCAITVAEVYAGMRPHEQTRTEELLQRLEYYEITMPIAARAGLLKRDWASRGVTLSLPDVTIAAVALAHDLTLLTDNVKHFPMAELRVYRLPYVQ